MVIMNAHKVTFLQWEINIIGHNHSYNMSESRDISTEFYPGSFTAFELQTIITALLKL